MPTPTDLEARRDTLGIDGTILSELAGKKRDWWAKCVQRGRLPDEAAAVVVDILDHVATYDEIPEPETIGVVPADAVTLAVAAEYADPVLTREKWLTVRLPNEYDRTGIERAVDRGERVWLLTPDEAPVATVLPFAAVASSVVGVVTSAWAGKRGFYDALDDLIETLEGYYPQRQIAGDTDVDVVMWSDVRGVQRR